MVLVRIDRNPGRVVMMCKALWLQLPDKTFTSCARYTPAAQPLSSDIPTFAKDTVDEFQKFFVQAMGTFVPAGAPAGV